MGFASKKTLKAENEAQREFIKLLEQKIKDYEDTIPPHVFEPGPSVCVSCGYGYRTDFHYPPRRS